MNEDIAEPSCHETKTMCEMRNLHTTNLCQQPRSLCGHSQCIRSISKNHSLQNFLCTMMLARSASRRLAPVGKMATRCMATQSQQIDPQTAKSYFAIAAAALAAGSAVTLLEAPPKQEDTQPYEFPNYKQINEGNNPPPRPDLPTIPYEEVNEHCDEESLWYTFRGGVYDLTFFLNGHPGGAPRLVSWNLICCCALFDDLHTLCSLTAHIPALFPSIVDGCRSGLGTILGNISAKLSRTCCELD